MKKEMIREKLIIENELKFRVLQSSNFSTIYNYLSQNYRMRPYKNAQMYDKYFDTPDMKLFNNGIAFRVRNRPQISINVKLTPIQTGSIWSRYEYSSKVDKIIKIEKDILNLSCDACNVIRSYLGNDYENLSLITTIKSFRIGFNVYFKDKNVLGNDQLLGVAFFDFSTNTAGKRCYEFEMESYEQTDVFASPYIFNEFNSIGDYLIKNGFERSNNSKFARLI